MTNQDIIDAYKRTGSVWRAGKELGVSGQLVHQRLKALDYKLPSGKWTPEEDTELAELVNEGCTLGEISRRLGRPYSGVAIRASRAELPARARAARVKDVPRGAGYDKKAVQKHMKSLLATSQKYTQYCIANGLSAELLARSIQKHDAAWWQAYVANRSNVPEKQCPYCLSKFIPSTGKQEYCSRKCSSDQRSDTAYFGGNRRNTVGLAEKTCQLCERQVEKGLSSHHLIGKDRDPDGESLIALCPGCHQLVGLLAGRTFINDEEKWENLINLVLLRRFGDDDQIGFFTTVGIERITEENAEQY